MILLKQGCAKRNGPRPREAAPGQEPELERSQEMEIRGYRHSGSLRPTGDALASQRTRRTFSCRVTCSFKALGIAWLISGAIFCIIIKGPDTVSTWCIWGSALFALGWLFVGLPLVALGELLRRVPFPIRILAGGLGGALVMALPTIVFGFYLPPGAQWKHSFDDLKWEGIAFVIAALTTALYHRFLNHEATD